MNYRHGDMALIGVKEVPEEAKKSKSKTLMVGSGQHPHTFGSGDFYTVEGDEFVIGYLEAKNTVLFHAEHGVDVGKSVREAKIDDGVYELRRQVEFVNGQMRQVED